ncbi:SPOR domain-containing protein [Bizionia argentinensis JUB59]|uniref:SPOR domain-containing protein n=1 Tax=Bizionia argentinensis JUB59 TaxID=1046627 RepID=G2EFR6_9FLAO|nr:SPOR domain-containing protein [Bizionia argentinensis JUB59]
MNLYSTTLLTLSIALSVSFSYAQQGTVTINKSSELDALLLIKKEMSVSNNDSDRYKIQIYSGDRAGADDAIKHFKVFYPNWNVIDLYDPNNYKVWVGDFRNRLEVDRALIKIKEEFRDAFRLKPKNKEKK